MPDDVWRAGGPSVAWQSDTYVTRGGPGNSSGEPEAFAEVYVPRFTWHACRYVEVTGAPGVPRVEMTGMRLASDVADAGSFECSNELLNRIQAMCRRTFLANLLSVQSDCPHRERFGYGGDIVATCDAFMLNFDMSGFYAKAVRDFSDAARPDGIFTDTAPFVGIQYCGVGWGMAHPLLLTQLRRHYADEGSMTLLYPDARRWLLRVAQDYPAGLITHGLSDHEGLAEAPPDRMVTPLFIQSARMLADMAKVLGRPEDVAEFESLAARSLHAHREAFPLGSPGETQASLAFALHTDLVPEHQRERAVEALVHLIRQGRGVGGGKLSTGILGTKFMLDVLSDAGRADVAYEIVNRTDFPGWGWMLENGATTLWEHWEKDANTFSHSHPMFGSVSEWMFRWLGGIQPAPDALGFDSIVIRPQFVSGLDWVRSSHRALPGLIVSQWRRDTERVIMDVEIPVGCTALVYVPAHGPECITESGRNLSSPPTSASKDVHVVRTEPARSAGRAVVCRIGSGRYSFVITRAP
jgi:alpha-L-rhamnosidase